MGYALAWMVQRTPQRMSQLVKSDVHSPAMYRVIGPLAHMDSFYKTFNITEGKYYLAPEQRVTIW